MSLDSTVRNISCGSHLMDLQGNEKEVDSPRSTKGVLSWMGNG